MGNSKDLAKNVGSKIRALRQRRGLSLEKLALECDMNAAFLGHVERGMRCPTIFTLQRICEGLEISLAELFLEDTPDTPNAAVIQHVSAKMESLTSEQAQHIADIVDIAIALLK